MTQVYCVFCDIGVAVCASNAERIIVTKTKTKNFLSIKTVEYLRRFFAGGGTQFELCLTWRSNGRRSSTWRQCSNQRAARSQSLC